MKNILTFIIILTAHTTFAQSTEFGNFKLENQEIIYQKVFTQDSITVALLEEFYKTLPYVSGIKTSPEGLTFEVQNIVVDYKKFQFSQVATPTVIQSGLYSGKVTVGVRAGKYRVTMNAIQLTGDIGYKKITTKDNLTNYAARNSGTVLSPDWCKPNWLGLLDQAFTDKLQYIPKKKSDW